MKAPGSPIAQFATLKTTPLKKASSAIPAPRDKSNAVPSAEIALVSLPKRRNVNILVSRVMSLKIGKVSAIAPSKLIPVPNKTPSETALRSKERFVRVLIL